MHTLNNYELIKNQLPIKDCYITELILIHKNNPSKSLLIYGAISWDKEQKEHFVLTERKNQIRSTYSIEHILYLDYDDCGKVIYASIANNIVFLEKLIEINPFEQQTKDLLELLAIYFHNQQVDKILESDLLELQNKSELCLKTEKIIDILDQNTFILKENNSYSFALPTSKSYHLAKLFLQYGHGSYKGKLRIPLPKQVYALLYYVKLPSEFSNLEEKLKCKEMLLQQCLKEHHYEQAAKTKGELITIFTYEIATQWNELKGKVKI